MIYQINNDYLCGWHVIFADGYINRDAVRDAVRAAFPNRRENICDFDDDVLEVAEKAAIGFCSGEEQNRVNRYRERGELYIVTTDQAPAQNRSKAGIITDLAGETSGDYRLLVSVAANCVCQEQCLQHVMDSLQMGPKPPDSYQDAEAFKNELEKIGQDIFEAFVAPCIIAEKRLRKAGLACVHDSPV